MLRRIAKGENKAESITGYIKQIDAFPKVESHYVESNSFGGVVTLFCWIGIAALLYSEISDFLLPTTEYRYTVDKEANQQLAIHLDMTVAMPCSVIGADVLDVWGRAIGSTEMLKEELVPYELAQNQKMFLKLQGANKASDQAHASLEEMLGDNIRKLVPRDDKGQTVPKDACRLHGKIPIDKITGNFHILSGRSVQIPGMGHAHLQFGEVKKNFSHRIEGLTFGDRVYGMLYALDGEEKIAPTQEYSYQYFVQIVPTKYITEEMNVQTYQYTVQEEVRAVDHSSSSNHGTPGILIKYEFSPVAAIVERKTKNGLLFVIRMLGVVGGIISTSGLLNLLITETFTFVCCCFQSKKRDENGAEAVPQ